MRFTRSLTLLFLLAALPALADVKLPAVFCDNMVLQRGIADPVWGWAAPGEQVTVSIAGQQVKATAGADGNWKAKLAPLQAGGPFEMTVAGNNTLTLKNVMVGEVWVCSGQSNMEWVVRNVNNAAQEIAAANYPGIRMFTVTKIISYEPKANCTGWWAICSPQTVSAFSAVGYFFGRELHKALGVPVGLINTSWGGTPAQSWTDRQSYLDNPLLKPTMDYTDSAMQKYANATETAMREWLAAVDKAKAEGKPLPTPPFVPGDPRSSAAMPTGLYNGMVAPLIPFGIAGAIWYQGESNAGQPALYRTLFPAMISGWRRAWGQGDFPFLFVQLANFYAQQTTPVESGWAELREAQTLTLALPNTGMATIIDIGEAGDIHPRNKQDVGKRLALWAQAQTYGKKDVVYSGPMYDSMTVEGNKIRLRFQHLGGGLVTKDGGPLKGFAIAGADGKFVWADTVIDGDSIVVSSAEVANPTIVRYAWANNPVCNLYNKAGLPAVPFRTDVPK
ncbi:MAG: sialate O-acetylesterase [Armatimonadota bacterium]